MQSDKNDQYDLYMFYLLPYINIFITENNNADIAKQIKRALHLSDLEIKNTNNLKYN